MAEAPKRLPHNLKRALRPLGIALGVALVLLLCVEGWRQNDIRVARNERNEVIRQVVAPYAEVEDWRAWLRERNPGRDGLAPLARVIAELKRNQAAIQAIQWAQVRTLQDDLRNPDRPRSIGVPVADLRRFVDDTAQIAALARDLRNCDHLLAVRETDPGEDVDTILLSAVMGVMGWRSIVLAWLQQLEQAAEEAVVAAEIAARFYPASFSIGFAVAAKADSNTHSWVPGVLARSRLTVEQAQRVRNAATEVPDQQRYVIETEDLYAAAALRRMVEPDRTLADKAWGSWFGWRSPVDETDVSDAGVRFTEPAQSYRLATQDWRVRLELGQQVRAGGAITVPVPRDMIGNHNILRDLYAGNARRQMTRAVAEIRLREARGEAWATIATNPGTWPLLDVRPDGAAIILQYKPLRGTQDAFAGQTVEWNELGPDKDILHLRPMP